MGIYSFTVLSTRNVKPFIKNPEATSAEPMESAGVGTYMSCDQANKGSASPTSLGGL